MTLAADTTARRVLLALRIENDASAHAVILANNRSRVSPVLKLYHAEPVANSLKSLIPLKEKGLAFESVYVDLHKFEQHEPWFVAINPEGQVPVLDHDGIIITHTTVINEYLEDAFPDAPPLRPNDARGQCADALLEQVRRRACDELRLDARLAPDGRRASPATSRAASSRSWSSTSRCHEQREKWRTARSGFSEADLANATRKIEVAVDKVEAQLGRDRMAGRRQLHLGRHQFLFALRDDGRADVPRPHRRAKASADQ